MPNNVDDDGAWPEKQSIGVRFERRKVDKKANLYEN